MAVGVTWQLEFCCGSAEDGLAELFCWGPLMLVCSGLSSWTSSLSPEDNPLVFCLEAGGPVRWGSTLVWGSLGLSCACLHILRCFQGAVPPPPRLPPSIQRPSVLPSPESKPPVLGQGMEGTVTQLHGAGRSSACFLNRLSHDADRSAHLLPRFRSDRGH